MKIVEKSKTEYLFDFTSFVDELRHNDDKKVNIEKYEKLVLKGKKITNDILKQKWYKNYLSCFKPIPDFKVPEELKNDFDWKILFTLIAGSYSSEYRLEYVHEEDKSKISLPELFVNVSSKDQSTEKKISELWSFQILRLFEIYCEEQMNFESISAESKEDALGIYNARREKKEYFSKITSKLSSENIEEIKSIQEGEKNEYIACHYCSLESAFNIIKSGNIFASDLSYMNDRDELIFGRDCLINAFNEIVMKTHDEDFSNWLKQQIDKVRIDYDKDIVYLSCFSKKLDDLNQWRAYGDNGYGICIVFDFNVTLNDPDTDGFIHTDVTYLSRDSIVGSKEWMELVKNIEKEFLTLFLEKNRQSAESDATVSISENFTLSDSIKIHLRFYKNDCFIEEAEFRCISLNRNNKYNIKTRVGRGYIIPYIEMKLSNKDSVSAIKEIIIGPSVTDFEKSKKSLELFLKEYGYDTKSIIIRRSKIPYNP